MLEDKKCSACKDIKPLSEFHKCSAVKDGKQSACKECASKFQKTDERKRYQAAYRKTDNFKRSHAIRQKTDTRKITMRKAASKYRTKNPAKTKAQQRANYAVKCGWLTKPDNCEECSNTEMIEGHHDDYSLALVVRWMCRRCHKAWHAENGYGLNG